MKKYVCMTSLFLLASCSTVEHVQHEESVREPASKVSMSCSEIVNAFFKATPASPTEIPKITKDIKVIKQWSEEYTFEYTFAHELEVDEGAILIPHKFKENEPMLDSLNRPWDKVVVDEEIFFRRYLDASKKEFVQFEAMPLTEMSVKTLVEISTGQQITIVIPSRDVSSLNGLILEYITKMLAELPKDFVQKVKKVSISPGHFFDKKDTLATANFEEITFYAKKVGGVYATNFTFTPELIRHEFGHSLAHQIYGSAVPNDDWKRAIKLDRASVSDYGDTMIEEDFAEAVELYLRLEAEKNLADKRWLKYKHRFAELDQIFHNDPQLHYRVARTVAMKRKLPLRLVVFGTASGGAYYLWNTSGTDSE